MQIPLEFSSTHHFKEQCSTISYSDIALMQYIYKSFTPVKEQLSFSNKGLLCSPLMAGLLDLSCDGELNLSIIVEFSSSKACFNQRCNTTSSNQWLKTLMMNISKCVTRLVCQPAFFLPEFMLVNKDFFLINMGQNTIMKGSITFLQEPVMFSTGSFFLLFSERNGEVKRIQCFGVEYTCGL